MIKLFLFLLALIPTTVFASDYQYSLDKIESNENIVVEEEKLYKYYEEEIVYTKDYYEEGSNPEEYPYQSDIITSQNTYNLLEKPEEKPNRNITIKNITAYRRLQPIKRIVIRDIRTGLSSRNLNITEIEIYNGTEKVNFNYYCFLCDGYTPITLNNSKYNDKNSTVSFKSIIDIRLKDSYYPEDLKVVVYFQESTKFTFSFNIYYYDQTVNDLFDYNATYSNLDYIVKKIELNTSSFSSENAYLGSTNIKINKSDIINYKWEKNKISETKEPNYFYQELPNFQVYNCEDILFKYYKKNKKYLKGYYLDMPDYIKDESDFIIRYKYKGKEKNVTPCPKCEVKKEAKDNINNLIYNVEQKTVNQSKIYKFRHILAVIIILVLSLMTYTIYVIRKKR